MSKSQRDKGARRERQLVELLKAAGIDAEKVPLSGAARYQGGGHDVDIYPRGRDYGALVAEVKARKDGEGFVTLEGWLGENDVLVLWKDRTPPYVFLPWRTWISLLEQIKS